MPRGEITLLDVVDLLDIEYAMHLGQIANGILPHYLEYLAPITPERRGGYICIWKEGRPEPFLLLQIGQVPAVKAKKYMRFAYNKARYLILRKTRVSSWQAREMKRRLPGGGVRLKGGWVIAFSGFLEDADEAFVLALADKVGKLDREYAEKILSISDNICYRQYASMAA